MDYIKRIDNSTIKLGQKIAEGGEGQIFEVDDGQNNICKIFKLDNEKLEVVRSKNEKLEAMAAKPFGSPEVIWPSKDSLVVTRLDKQSISGILMPFIKNKEDLNQFINSAKDNLKDQIKKDPANREKYIAKSQLELIEVALKFLAVVAKLHYFGIILGDINKGNFLITKSIRSIYFIDTDSYQLGNEFLCNVGKPEYMAPELQHYKDIRTVENELFAIAVVIFEMLVYNEHPYRNSTSGETRYDKIIKQGYFAYPFTDENRVNFGDESKIYKSAEFYNKLIWQEKFPNELKAAFHKSFAKDCSNVNNIKRTTVPEWLDVLKKYKSILSTYVTINPLVGAGKDKLFPGQIGLNNILEYARSMFQNRNRQHLFISALAGTGKTTTLKKIATEFGPKHRTESQWLYLVYNKKNQLDAEKENEFRNLSVNTTHSFMLRHIINKNDCFKSNNLDLVIEKNKLKKILEHLDCFKPYMVIDEEIEKDYNTFTNFEKKAIVGIFHNLKYHFKSTLKKLVELSKAYAIDPRREFEAISIEFDDVLHDYDLTTVFDEVVYSAVINEINKINKKYNDVINPERRDAIIEAVVSINKKYKKIINFNYHEAICKACHAVLKESLPRSKKTIRIWNKRNRCHEDYELGQLCDFDDWLWWPAIMAKEVAWPKFNCVLLDEVQDFNRCQLVIIQELAKRGAKIIAVGDKHQAIYRFRGADGEIFDKINRFLQNDTNRVNENTNIDIRYGLQVNYRCSRNVIDFVNERTVTKDLIACDTAIDGFAEYKNLNCEGLFTFLKENNDRAAILSRVNNNIRSLLLEFLKREIPFTSKREGGQKFEIVQDLISEANDFCEENDLEFYRISTQDFIREAGIILGALERSVNNYEFDVDEIREKIKSYKHLLELIAILNANIFFKGTFGLNDLFERLDSYIEEQSKLPNAVIMMTIHASKGSEYDTVVMIDDDSIPLKRLKQEADLIQEENLRYVGYTRAKKNLIVCKQAGLAI